MAITECNPDTFFPGQLAEFLSILDVAEVPAKVVRSKDGVSVCYNRKLAAERGVKLGGLANLCGYSELPLSTEQVAGGRVERQDFRPWSCRKSRLAYWGTPAALVEAGIAPLAEVTPGARSAKGSSGGLREWHSYFAPSGKVYYTVEIVSDERAAERAAEHEKRASLVAAIRRGEEIPLARRDFEGGTEWMGSREELLASGVCRAEHFPVGAKRTSYDSERDMPEESRRPGVWFWRTNRVSGNYFSHCVDWDKETSEGAAQLRKIAAKKIAEEPMERTAQFSTPSAFADHAERFLMASANVAVGIISGCAESEKYGECTMRYPAQTVAQVEELLEHARQLLQSATPVSIKAKARDSRPAPDAAFTRFLASTLAPKPVAGRNAR